MPAIALKNPERARIELRLTNCLAQGQTRDVYQHPTNPAKIIKVAKTSGSKRSAGLEANRLELANYPLVANRIGQYLVGYSTGLSPTTRGHGLVCDRVIDHDGSNSRPFSQYRQGENTSELRVLFENFFAHLLITRCYFFDFNPGNFVIQQGASACYLKYVDLKSYRLDRNWLPLTRWSERAARSKLRRRSGRFITRWFG